MQGNTVIGQNAKVRKSLQTSNPPLPNQENSHSSFKTLLKCHIHCDILPFCAPPTAAHPHYWDPVAPEK